VVGEACFSLSSGVSVINHLQTAAKQLENANSPISPHEGGSKLKVTRKHDLFVNRSPQIGFVHKWIRNLYDVRPARENHLQNRHRAY